MTREVLLVPPMGDNVEAAQRAAELLSAGNVTVRPPRAGVSANVELVLVLGGDGTFLRAADLAHEADLPVLGINLGHVGFLAEWEAESLEEAVGRVIDRDYRVEDRMTIDATVLSESLAPIAHGWALNEVSIENVHRHGVLDASLEVDGRPVSSFGCDGVLISTPTGSTAYAFSAGGPVLWPELDAILVVPNNAHALFTKPLVISPHSTAAVESLSPARVVMDGFREVTMPAGARVEAARGKRPVRWVRLDDSPFADRLVSKLDLPVQGWRGRKDNHAG
ncbi:NAD kinase [Corynebacterium mastitidis]|uniref:NAD kinase n=1 Tax=Corynebacterium mastitidis TaxID=161890 RepID=A0A2N0XAP2_9CORY|nr:NAD kinase [Corynebacterium mastitidis]MCH6196167.1 NAD kinase [Corynebacterium mastitidis]PKF69770.1 NAD kinase [Corynebacterium mastitidis]